MTSGSAPRVSFVIGGVQKAGTTALASFLACHPDVVLPQGKEAHVFDAPDFNDGWGIGEVDRRYEQHFSPMARPDALHGDATPIYLLHPVFVRRIARYNPKMRWIILLRDPVERALSQYHMEHDRGFERLPFWWALLAERWRLLGHADDFSLHSPLRHHSYRLRGDYARQIDVLRAEFPVESVLVLRSEDLSAAPKATMEKVVSFLKLRPFADDVDYGRVFEGGYARWSYRDWRWKLLRWWWRSEFSRQAKIGLDWRR